MLFHHLSSGSILQRSAKSLLFGVNIIVMTPIEGDHQLHVLQRR